jgi:hypothetical protein
MLRKRRDTRSSNTGTRSLRFGQKLEPLDKSLLSTGNTPKSPKIADL